jgi:hypothetical protein
VGPWPKFPFFYHIYDESTSRIKIWQKPNGKERKKETHSSSSTQVCVELKSSNSSHMINLVSSDYKRN